MLKKIYFDCETTGIDPKKHALIQLAGIIVIDGIEQESFNFLMAPFPHQEVEAEALEVNGVTQEDLLSFPQPKIVFDELIKRMSRYVNRYNTKDKFHFVAYNSPFDSEFVRAFFENCGDKYYGSWFWTPDHCLMRWAAHRLAPVRHELSNFRLETVARRMGIDAESMDLHDAYTDIRLAMQIEQLLNVETIPVP